MRTGFVVGWLVALVVGGALVTSADAMTEIEKDERAVRKFAVPFNPSLDVTVSGKPKGLCVCLEDSSGVPIHSAGIVTFRRVDDGAENRIVG